MMVFHMLFNVLSPRAKEPQSKLVLIWSWANSRLCRPISRDVRPELADAGGVWEQSGLCVGLLRPIGGACRPR